MKSIISIYRKNKYRRKEVKQKLKINLQLKDKYIYRYIKFTNSTSYPYLSPLRIN